MNWKAQLGIGLLVVAVAIAGVWLWRDSVWRGRIAGAPAQRDTVYFVEPHTLPPAVVTPNPSPVTVVIRPDSSRVDSLLRLVTNRDSLIRALVATKGAEQSFSSKDPTGLTVSGDLTVLFSPLEDHFLTEVTLDTVQVPVKFITVEHTVVNKTVSWEWILTAACVGGVVGSLLTK